jgi:hypothetical protein
MDRKN